MLQSKGQSRSQLTRDHSMQRLIINYKLIQLYVVLVITIKFTNQFFMKFELHIENITHIYFNYHTDKNNLGKFLKTKKTIV